MLSCEDFKREYLINDEMMADSGLSWDDLVLIHNDFDKKQASYRKTLDQFIESFIKPLTLSENGERPVINSMRSRVKDPVHLMAKAVRKKRENYRKYEGMDAHNYEKFFTDLAGVRCLLLFKEDWVKLHHYLISDIPNDESRYITGKYIERYDSNPDALFHAEAPKIHIRTGDAIDLYKSEVGEEHISDGRIYRSAHYIIRYQGVYIEIQARTLFEESWGEIDHAIVYPYHEDDPVFKEYTGLLNRLTGLADEMASFFIRVEELETKIPDANSDNSSRSENESDSGDSSKPVTVSLPEENDGKTESNSNGVLPTAIIESIVESE